MVKLRVEYLLRFRDPRDRKAQVSSLPRTVDEAYQRLLNRIGPQDLQLAFRVFCWIFYVHRPLLIQELCEALSIREKDTDLDIENIMSPHHILECCSGMIVIESDSSVRFVHHTVKDFLRREHLNRLQPDYITRTCIQYLSFDQFDLGPLEWSPFTQRLEKYEFSSYAAVYWCVHAREESHTSPIISEAVVCFLESENRRNSMLQIAEFMGHGSFKYPMGFTRLHILVKEGLERAVILVLKAESIHCDRYFLCTFPHG